VGSLATIVTTRRRAVLRRAPDRQPRRFPRRRRHPCLCQDRAGRSRRAGGRSCGGSGWGPGDGYAAGGRCTACSACPRPRARVLLLGVPVGARVRVDRSLAAPRQSPAMAAGRGGENAGAAGDRAGAAVGRLVCAGDAAGSAAGSPALGHDTAARDDLSACGAVGHRRTAPAAALAGGRGEPPRVVPGPVPGRRHGELSPYAGYALATFRGGAMHVPGSRCLSDELCMGDRPTIDAAVRRLHELFRLRRCVPGWGAPDRLPARGGCRTGRGSRPRWGG